MKRFEPLRTYASPSRRAVVRIAALSEPEPDSVSAYAGSHSPLASFGRYLSFCSSVPASLSPSDPSSCTARISPLVAQTFETSSIATSESSVPVPSPPYSSAKKSPKMSFSRNSSTTSQGNSCDSSISAARGAIRSRASCRTRSRSSRCSPFRTSQGTAGRLMHADGDHRLRGRVEAPQHRLELRQRQADAPARGVARRRVQEDRGAPVRHARRGVEADHGEEPVGGRVAPERLAGAKQRARPAGDV